MPGYIGLAAVVQEKVVWVDVDHDDLAASQGSLAHVGVILDSPEDRLDDFRGPVGVCEDVDAELH